MAPDNRKAKQWFTGDEGSMTLEASVTVPWIMMIVMALILLLLAAAQKAIVYYSASMAAERTAFAWTHSASDIRTGAYPPDGYDSLYWRLGRDELLGVLFGSSPDREPVSVRFGSQESAVSNAKDGSARAKLRKTAAAMPDGLTGEIVYRNELWKRVISVQAAGGRVPDPMSRLLMFPGSRITASVTAWVAEPAETVRTFDLIGHYRAIMKSKGEGEAEYREQAAGVLRQPR